MNHRRALVSLCHELAMNISIRLEKIEGADEIDQAYANQTLHLIDIYTEQIAKVYESPEEIEWNLLSAQSFITSIQTTTGYGDMVPVTTWGKIFSLVYALIGIPIFMWYIVKLGGLFRVLAMKLIGAAINCAWYEVFPDQISDYNLNDLQPDHNGG